MENDKKIFVDGLMFNYPHENAPDFIKGKISINAPALTNFMNLHKNEKGWLTVILKKSKGGKMYFELDTWKPKTQETVDTTTGEAPKEEIPYPEDINPEDIPF